MIRTLTFLLAVFGTYCTSLAQITVSIAITGGTNPTCAGRNITFTATPKNAGTAPSYAWYVNGVLVPGAVGTSFTTNSLANGDYVNAKIKATTTPFDSALSPAINMVVVPNITPAVIKSITAGSNPGCKDSLIQFTATTTNAGATPTYRWYINGTAVATTAIYNNYTASNGDKIWVRVIATASSTACYTRDTAYSDTTTLARLPTPALPVISFIGHDLVSDSANVQWYGPAGLIPTATGQTYRPTVQGDYYAVLRTRLCGTGKSNVLTVSPLDVSNYNLSNVQMYPNPTTGQLTITWGTPSTTRITVYTPFGQSVMHDVATVSTRKVLDLSRLASGIYFVMLQDEHGKSGAVRVTVTK